MRKFPCTVGVHDTASRVHENATPTFRNHRAGHACLQAEWARELHTGESGRGQGRHMCLVRLLDSRRPSDMLNPFLGGNYTIPVMYQRQTSPVDVL